MKKNELMEILPPSLKKVFEQFNFNFDSICELRFRISQPLSVRIGQNNLYISADGNITSSAASAYKPNVFEIKGIVELISRFSPYAYEEEIKNGFITLKGGHRAGLCGQVTMENGKIKTFKQISSLNLRLAREIKGCADGIIKLVTRPCLKHVMIISPPLCGKTTLLRDLIRQLSDGTEEFKGINVGLVDERSEIAACIAGVAQNDVGSRTDIIDCAPKSEAMIMLLRSMSPQIVAVDEIGGQKDIQAIFELLNAGVKIICTAHGNDLEDILTKPNLKHLMSSKIFELFICLGYNREYGSIRSIYNKDYERLEQNGH